MGMAEWELEQDGRGEQQEWNRQQFEDERFERLPKPVERREPNPGVWCGTVTGYVYRRCGCEKCRAAWAEYMKGWKEGLPVAKREAVESEARARGREIRRLRAELVREGLLEPPEHGYYGYTAWGCQCDVCRDANRVYHAQLRAERYRLFQ